MTKLARRYRPSMMAHSPSLSRIRTTVPLDKRTEAPQSLASGLDWFALVTNPNCEWRALAGLREAGIDAFLPVLSKWVSRSAIRREVERPLFARYLFVGQPVGAANWWKIRRVDGVERVVGVDGVPMRIPAADLARLAQWQAEGRFEFDMHGRPRWKPSGGGEPFEVGAQVTVTSGPFASFLAVVKATAGFEKPVETMLSIFGRETIVHIPVEDLQLAC